MRGLKETRLYHAAMMAVLNRSRNVSKGHWRSLSELRLLWLMLVEYLELFGAVICYRKALRLFEQNPSLVNMERLSRSREHVLAEAADNGNFGMMIADKCEALRCVIEGSE